MPDNTQRVYIIHTLQHALEVLEAARTAKKSVILQSAPDALRYAGGLYLLHLFEQAHGAYRDVDAICILDCGTACAEAISAMQSGHKHIRTNATPEIRVKIASIAQQLNVTLHTQKFSAVNLLHVRNVKEIFSD